MSSTDTTIKVPRRLRDRISERAKREHVTLAVAIEHALDESEELAFWGDVRRHHASMSDEDRQDHLVDHALRDDLDDPADDALSDEEAW
ncbi:hypothetical protein DFP74_6291 [Nocardiopsis sp. Huas11]|uniref:hypothetical protein n=1 Tax=Nocardiopsis sp. Huas11 TaxID=2183912 RepID=UPI000EB34306|nr:hypothetical protein [Nocardiopsis sp. Huas11]RKS10519.1 hypothetical protein DFP74_6291 [Nocardiopsis sp. Huas11]